MQVGGSVVAKAQEIQQESQGNSENPKQTKVIGWVTTQNGNPKKSHNDIVPNDRVNSDSTFLIKHRKVDSVTTEPVN